MSRFISVLCLVAALLSAAQPFRDCTYDSKVFNEPRHFRIFVPLDYETSAKRYPVIYYLHGHSDRYTLESYDKGLDTVPKIAAFVAAHDLIVVAVDGYIARDYTEFYGGTPYDVRREGGDFDFGPYFLELVGHIDANYRTLTARRDRATSGLSMGGFMSLYLSARYPEWIGSASAFNPGPEFFVGEKGRRSLWRPKDHVANHEQTAIRLIRASGDYISQYHEETRDAYARSTVDFEYRQDEYHRHWTTSIAETFDFHMRAFQNPALEATPVEWNYASAFQKFSIRGYDVAVDAPAPAVVLLEDVRQGGLRVRTREWAPDGPAVACSSLSLVTAPLYHAGSRYEVLDYHLASGKSSKDWVTADSKGRIHFQVDCSGHQVGFTGPGAGAQPPVVLPLTSKDFLRPRAGKPVGLPVRILNTRSTPLDGLKVKIASDYPTVAVTRGSAELKQLAPGSAADLSSAFEVRFQSAGEQFTHARLRITLTYDGYHEITRNLDVEISPDELPQPLQVEILDGRARTFPVFRQTGNQGGGASIERTVNEGSGNGDGVLQPGERATVWVKLRQGLDPFDRGNWCRAKVYSESPLLTEVGDIQEDKQREWTSAQSRTSLIQLSREIPSQTDIPVVLDCESWSFHYTPDVRYGKQPLYQAFQLHKHHLFAWNCPTGVMTKTQGF